MHQQKYAHAPDQGKSALNIAETNQAGGGQGRDVTGQADGMGGVVDRSVPEGLVTVLHATSYLIIGL